MTTQDTREVFTLVLNSAKTVANGGFVLDSTNQTNANVLYQINFDSLFQGKNQMYKYAQLRGQLIAERVSVSALPNTIGYISIVGFSQKNSLGVVASPIIFAQNPQPASTSGDTTAGYYYPGFRSTLASYEAYELCTLPQGIQNIQVQFTSLTDAIQAGGNMGNYNLILQFELYN